MSLEKSFDVDARVFQTALLNWFDQHGRKHLPWQQNKTPYRVWVSEIMLQQTQVATVIPYFERFMQRFPDLARLAHASEDEVLHLWAGLGYYSRARHLHRAAKLIMQQHQGKFPDNLLSLKSLPGIGQSTAGAILAIAFNQSTAILDGNVKRVLARFQGIRSAPNEKLTEQLLWQFANYYTPTIRVADYTQAMMDLGATLCTRSKPDCPRCPLLIHCYAAKHALTDSLPAKKVSKKIPVRTATFLILKNGKKTLLQKQAPTKIWGGLWSLPQMANKPQKKIITDFCHQKFRATIKTFKRLKKFRHTFSHYHLDIFPIVINVEKVPAKISEANQIIWYDLDAPAIIGLPKPVQTLLKSLEN